MIKRLVIAVALLALVGGGLIGFNLFRDRMIAQVFADMPVPASRVETAVAERVTWRPTINAIGTVNASQGVELSVEAAGVVTEIAFASNDTVEKGALLLRLDDVVQRADLEAAETQLDLDRLTLDRQRELSERGVTANQSLDSSEAAYRVSQAQVARANAVLAQRSLDAPFSGVIGLPRVDLGQFVEPGTGVATLQDLEVMRVDFSLPEQRLNDVEIDQALSVRVEGIDAVHSGQITGIDPRVDPASRLFAVRGTVENVARSLTPGQFVRIEVELPAEEGVIALPQTAVISSLYGDYVYVVRTREGDEEQLEARQVFVEPGRRSEGMIEIRSGLSAGDLVVASGQNRLSSGAPVTIDEAAAAPDDGVAAGGNLQQEAAAR
jgi:membrane fusion protein, multidrug efflux system